MGAAQIRLLAFGPKCDFIPFPPKAISQQLEGTYKDGKWEGLWTGWHSENGQKMFEGTYKKGKKVSAKYWNIEGIEVENLDEAEDYPMGDGL